MSWQLIPLTGGLGDQAEPWDALNRRINRGHAMLASRFVDALLANFAAGSELLCVEYGADNQPTSMLILQASGKARWQSFLPSQAQIAPALTTSHTDYGALLKALPQPALMLNLLCQDPRFSQGRDFGNKPASYVRHALTISVPLTGEFDAYWAARSGTLKKNIQRYRNRVATENLEPRFVRIADETQMRAALGRYAALEMAGWKGQAGTAVRPDDAQGRFYASVLESFAAGGEAAVYEYWLGEQLAASRLLIVSEEMMIIMKTTYDESLARFSPSNVLLHEVIRDAFARYPGRSIEFYTDASAERLVWANAQRWIEHQVVYRNAAVRTAIAGMKRLAGKPAADLDFKPYALDTELPRTFARLFEQGEAQSFDLGQQWFTTLAQTSLEADESAAFFSLAHGEHALAVLPGKIRGDRAGEKLSALGNFYTSLYAPLLDTSVAAPDVAQLVRGVAAAHPRLTRIQLAPMDPDSREFTTLKSGLREAGWIPFSYFCFGNWFLPVTGDWNAYLAQREGALRSTIRRMSRRFTEQGGRLEIVTGGKQLPAAIEAYETVYANSWKISEPYSEFVPALIRDAAANGSLRLGLAWLDGKPVAAQIWLVAHGKAAIYKLAYDTAYGGYSPGTLLSALLMEQALDRDEVREVDYLVGDDAYKEDWMTHRRERWGIIAFNPATPAGLFGAGRELGLSLLRSVFGPLRRGEPTLVKSNESI